MSQKKHQVITPKERNILPTNNLILFLAGSIEMGKAENWQKTLIEDLEKSIDKGLSIFNPRRDDWNSSWEQNQSNDHFNHQVNWELNSIERSDIIFVNFIPETMSPITLLELGKISERGNRDIVVCCPEGYWRRGNVEIVCTRAGIPFYSDYKSALGALKTKINSIC